MFNITLGDGFSGLRGEFSITLKDKDGNTVFTYTDHNMIVTGAKRALCQLLSNPGADGKTITQIGFGRSNITPTPNDTSLTGAYTKQIDSYMYPDNSRVAFKWSLDYDECNGMNIVEFGLITADNTLFARKVRGAIAKDSDLRLEGEWIIRF